MAKKEEAQAVEQAVEVSIEDFLKGLKDEDATLKGMFHHFTVKVQGMGRNTVAEFEAMFEKFKALPASELK